MGLPVFDSPLVQRTMQEYEPTADEKMLNERIKTYCSFQYLPSGTHLTSGLLYSNPNKIVRRGEIPSSVVKHKNADYVHCNYCSCNLKGSEIKNGCCPNCGAPVRR